MDENSSSGSRPAGRSETKTGTSALQNGIQVLKAFSREEPVLGVTEISRRVGLHKSTVSPILTTLEENALVERHLIQRENIDIDALYQDPKESRIGDVNWAAMISLLVGLVLTWLFLYGLVGPLQGPVARSLNGVDLSWLAGLLGTGALYCTLYRLGFVTPGPPRPRPERQHKGRAPNRRETTVAPPDQGYRHRATGIRCFS